MMNKKQVQKRVLKNGKPLALSKFTWCEKTNTFSSDEYGLVLDFKGVCFITFNTSSDCTFNTGSGCTFNTIYDCTFNTGSGCTFDTSSGCTFNTIYDCTFNTGSGCTFNTSSGCTFNTSSGCTFNTGSGCTFDTGSGCTFDTSSDCTFNTSYDCVIVYRNNKANVIQPEESQIIQTPPYNTVKGFIVDGIYNGKPHIVKDGILSEVISHKGNVYKVKNYGETKASYIVQSGDIYSHGKTIKEARDSLMYKISDRDTSKYDDLTLDSVLTKAECVAMYRTITGACESGTRYFVEQNEGSVKDKFTVKEIIALTKGQFGNDALVKFIGKE